jgi:hypothetical protein
MKLLVLIELETFPRPPVTVAEVSCPTKYSDDASSINLPRSIKYGFGCLYTALKFRFAKMKIIKSGLFPCCD